jgi:hypothetical protein
MNRICLSLALVFVLFAAAESRAATTMDTISLDADAMKAALHTAAPEEDGFIDSVLVLVNKGRLPVDLVESTFLWAKKKPQNKFQYFKRGLIWRAGLQGIKL